MRIGLLGLLILFSSFTVQAKIDNKLGSYPKNKQLIEYYQSGKYNRDLEQALNEAKNYLERQTQTTHGRPLAIVLDIDETALSNYPDLERLYFTRNVQALTGAYMLATAQAIPPVLELYQKAIEHDIAVFFISERPNTPEIISVTANNLRHAGFEHWQELILKPLDNDSSIQEFKTKARRHIALQGYDIILNIGDQSADLQGGFSEVKIKVPNPFYEIS